MFSVSDRRISPYLLAASLLCTLPVLIPTFPPLSDLPQHVASIMVLHEVHFGSYVFADLFEFNWFRPYWLGYGLVWLLTPMVGVVWAAKLVIAASLVALVIAFLLLRREINAPATLDWLFLAVPFGFAYEWGFLTFIVCSPFGVLFLVHYLRYLKGQTHWLWMLAWMVFLFFGHLLILAFVCVIASLLALQPPWKIRTLLGRIAPLLVSIPLGLAWILTNLEPRNVATPVDWELGAHRLIKLLPDLLSLDYTIMSMVLAPAMLSIPFVLGVRPKWTVSNVAPFAFYLLFMMLVPSTVFSNFGTYERFQLFGLMCFMFLLTDAEQEVPQSVARFAPVLLLIPVLVGTLIVSRMAMKSYAFEQESAGFRVMVESMEPGKRVYGMVESGYTEFARSPAYLHFPVWYQVVHKGLVDFNFAYYSSLNAYYKRGEEGKIYGRLVFFPDEFDFDQHDGQIYDYFIVKSKEGLAERQFGNESRVSFLRYSRGWYLFRKSVE
ncbi:MAG: hypothetical protein ISP91_01315 [Pseudomonadales bacterium]|nr:hypothetical protein [Pseudomonadales bacterium]